MKKVVAFLLILFIFVSPVTTLVKADVVIGDNDDTIINENATILGRKLALLESFSDLALSGVTEFTISNANDVDSYLDYLWEEIGNAIESLSDGTGFTEISDNLKSKYYTNLVQYKDYINNRGDYLSYTLQNPSTNLLQTYFANNIYGKAETKHYDLALDTFRALSRYDSSGNNGNPDPNYNIYINKMNTQIPYGFFWSNLPDISWWDGYSVITRPINNYSWFYCNNNTFYDLSYGNNGYTLGQVVCAPLLTLYINSTENNNYIGRIDSISNSWVIKYTYFPDTPYYKAGFTTSSDGNYNTNLYSYERGQKFNNLSYSYTGTLEQVFDKFSKMFRNVNIYVDGEPWSIVGDISYPTLDIDGFMKIYGNDTPTQYQLQPNTKIDYDQLYQVIYNAIRDNLPISQGDINYYDSHDTIYSPTIINNYGDEEGDESDLIDTILDYAVIPKFDTAIAQPMRQALTNGVLIMNNSITNVIPDEILLILGACFFLLLFAVVINRMIK